jgi:hypothetical protein
MIQNTELEGLPNKLNLILRLSLKALGNIVQAQSQKWVIEDINIIDAGESSPPFLHEVYFSFVNSSKIYLIEMLGLLTEHIIY